MAGKPKLLIIEDNADLLGILKQLLSPDYDVSTARRGEDGVALAAAIRPDLVILDLHLPQMNGIDAGRWIKRDVGPVPILVLTALSGQAEADAVMRSGCCDAYMSKPASLGAIQSRVAELLASGTGGRE
jgi:DNA-binding response OmpR family regulator